VKITRPIEKEATEITRKTSGERLIQIRTHQGTRWPGDRLQFIGHICRDVLIAKTVAYYMACFQVTPRSELTAEAMLHLVNISALKQRKQVIPENKGRKPEDIDGGLCLGFDQLIRELQRRSGDYLGG
jgi:hypothetical protein